jgi:hypothetical protein
MILFVHCWCFCWLKKVVFNEIYECKRTFVSQMLVCFCVLDEISDHSNQWWNEMSIERSCRERKFNSDQISSWFQKLSLYRASKFWLNFKVLIELQSFIELWSFVYTLIFHKVCLLFVRIKFLNNNSDNFR